MSNPAAATTTSHGPLQMPELIYLEYYEGNFVAFLNAVYEQFRIDFVDTRPYFQGTRLGLKSIPLVDGRECTFYHITHEGNDETNRIPDIRRMERIRYVKYLINHADHPELKVWEKPHKKDIRVLIYHEAEDYLIVLTKRRDYVLLWTAYLVIYPHTRKQLLKEYDDYIKANAAQTS